METPFAAYQGNEPCIFVCYAHEDSDVVYPEIAWLHEQGFKLWYDEGISAGKNWRAAIGDSLLVASHVLFYVSPHSLDSDHCNREINLALDEGKDIVPVYLEDVELTSDLKVGLNRVQALHRDHDTSYQQHLLNALGQTVEANLPSASQNPKLISSAKEVTSTPAIAVLPFVNMSGDQEQEYFADGLTEDIITELSRFDDLLVISRSAVFVYKGKSAKPRSIAREFGVDYVVEGSVRKMGDRVRITVQLIDAETEIHAWAENYDRKLEDIFTIQDEVTAAIVTTLSGRVEAAHHDRSRRKPPENLAAYEYVLRGKVLHHQSSPDANSEAILMLDKAIALDPDYADAHAWKGCVVSQAWIHNWVEDREAAWLSINEELQTALTLNDNNPHVHRMIAAVMLIYNEFDKAKYHQERALSLNPNCDLILVQQGELLSWLGRPEEGIDWIRRAMRLNPYHPERFWNHLGRAQYAARHYEDAIQSFSKPMELDNTHRAFLAAAYAHAGNGAAAANHSTQVLQREPSFTIDNYLSTLHYRQRDDLEHLRAGLIKAGFPEN